jgi:molybdate transport system substrate-binding protein
MANPLTAPYGKAAQEALQSAGLWDGIQSKLVYAESVAHALQMAETGNADVALVALALAMDAGRPFYLVEANLHQPIEQTVAVLRSSEQPQTAGAFTEFLFTPEGREILKRYGFEIPQ